MIRKRRKHNTFESLFFILLILVAGYVFFKSPLFDVQWVVVKGNQYLAEGDVCSAADIEIGVNIFKINLAVIGDRLKEVPMINDVRVSRALPATVLITVTERRPLGILPAGSGFVKVDQEGRILQTSGPGVPGIPLITGVKVDTLELGEIVQNDLLTDVLIMISGFPDEIIDNLSEVNIGPDYQIQAYTMDRIQCRLGEATDIEEKGIALAQILQELQKQGVIVKYVDVTSVGKPVVRY